MVPLFVIALRGSLQDLLVTYGFVLPANPHAAIHAAMSPQVVHTLRRWTSGSVLGQVQDRLPDIVWGDDDDDDNAGSGGGDGDVDVFGELDLGSRHNAPEATPVSALDDLDALLATVEADVASLRTPEGGSGVGGHGSTAGASAAQQEHIGGSHSVTSAGTSGPLIRHAVAACWELLGEPEELVVRGEHPYRDDETMATARVLAYLQGMGGSDLHVFNTTDHLADTKETAAGPLEASGALDWGTEDTLPSCLTEPVVQGEAGGSEEAVRANTGPSAATIYAPSVTAVELTALVLVLEASVAAYREVEEWRRRSGHVDGSSPTGGRAAGQEGEGPDEVHAGRMKVAERYRQERRSVSQRQVARTGAAVRWMLGFWQGAYGTLAADTEVGTWVKGLGTRVEAVLSSVEVPELDGGQGQGIGAAHAHAGVSVSSIADVPDEDLKRYLRAAVSTWPAGMSTEV